MSIAVEETVEKIRKDLEKIELEVSTKSMTLGDLIRLGSQHTEQAYGWGNGLTACALSASYLAARAKGLIE